MKMILVVLLMIFLAGCAVPRVAPTPTAAGAPTSEVGDEAKVRTLVEGLGKRLQNVALLAPDAAQEIQAQYSGFVSPALLKVWMTDPLHAPGRRVSSPWPDRIDINTLTRESPGRYRVEGDVVEITSMEVTSGGEADRIPFHLIVENDRGRRLITEYSEGP
jgi:hypothetical protein